MDFTPCGYATKQHTRVSGIYDKGQFVWPSPTDGKVVITPAQLGMLLEGIDWRMPRRTWRPELAG